MTNLFDKKYKENLVNIDIINETVAEVLLQFRDSWNVETIIPKQNEFIKIELVSYRSDISFNIYKLTINTEKFQHKIITDVIDSVIELNKASEELYKKHRLEVEEKEKMFKEQTNQLVQQTKIELDFDDIQQVRVSDITDEEKEKISDKFK